MGDRLTRRRCYMNKQRVCPECGATESEIRECGHRLVGKRPCPEACTCIPEHFNLREHREECNRVCSR